MVSKSEEVCLFRLTGIIHNPHSISADCKVGNHYVIVAVLLMTTVLLLIY